MYVIGPSFERIGEQIASKLCCWLVMSLGSTKRDVHSASLLLPFSFSPSSSIIFCYLYRIIHICCKILFLQVASNCMGGLTVENDKSISHILFSLVV